MALSPTEFRHTAEYMKDRLIITIPSKIGLFEIFILACWLIFWYFGENSALTTIKYGQLPIGGLIFMTVWISIWTYGAGAAIYLILWQLTGKDVIDITKESITTTRIICGFGLPKVYSAENIEDLCVFEEKDDISFIGILKSGKYPNIWWKERYIFISFYYKAKIIKIGDCLDYPEASEIVSIILQRFPQYQYQEVSER